MPDDRYQLADRSKFGRFQRFVVECGSQCIYRGQAFLKEMFQTIAGTIAGSSCAARHALFATVRAVTVHD